MKQSKAFTWIVRICALLACVTLSGCAPEEEGAQNLEFYPTGIQIIVGGDFEIRSYECEVLGIGSFEGSDLIIPTAHTFDDMAEEILKTAKEKGDSELEEKAKDFYKKFKVVRIADEAFKGCTQLTSVKIPDSVTYVGASAFEGCSNLQSVILPDSVESIAGNAFDGCPESLFTEYENGMYLGNDKNPYLVLMRVKDKTADTFSIHPDTRQLAAGVFEDYVALTRISLPQNITSFSFSGCTALEELVLPQGITEVEASWFEGCINLKNIVNMPQAQGLTYELNSDGASYSVTGMGTCTLTCFAIPSEYQGIPVTRIAEYAFCYPPEQEEIYANMSKSYRSLLKNQSSEDRKDTEKMKAMFIDSYGDEARLFFDIKSKLDVDMISLPDSIEYIEPNALLKLNVLVQTNSHYRFENGCLIENGTNALLMASNQGNIPAGVVRIENYAFSNCEMDSEYTIPNSVTYIADNAFYGWYSDSVFAFDGTVEQWNAIQKPDRGIPQIVCSDGIVEAIKSEE
ncbi:MAG: leucine-rich repeat protein [Clostridia bacterium]|nr:leucine-rich repeat protein [Clostridia bacterium]